MIVFCERRGVCEEQPCKGLSCESHRPEAAEPCKNQDVCHEECHIYSDHAEYMNYHADGWQACPNYDSEPRLACCFCGETMSLPQGCVCAACKVPLVDRFGHKSPAETCKECEGQLRELQENAEI